MSVAAFLDPAGCPAAPPQLQAMGAATRSLHEGVDAHIRRRGVAYLHPESPTLMLDALGSDPVIAWQEGKASFLFAGEGCWSELPQLYARYATTAGLRRPLTSQANAAPARTVGSRSPRRLSSTRPRSSSSGTHVSTASRNTA